MLCFEFALQPGAKNWKLNAALNSDQVPKVSKHTENVQLAFTKCYKTMHRTFRIFSCGSETISWLIDQQKMDQQQFW